MSHGHRLGDLKNITSNTSWFYENSSLFGYTSTVYSKSLYYAVQSRDKNESTSDQKKKWEYLLLTTKRVKSFFYFIFLTKKE